MINIVAHAWSNLPTGTRKKLVWLFIAEQANMDWIYTGGMARIVQRLGLSPEMVIRTVARLESLDLLKIDGARILIYDL